MHFIAPSTRSGHWAKRLAAAVAARGRGEWSLADYQSVRTQLELAVVKPRRAEPYTAPVYETRVERRWSEFKGPLAVRPVFVRTPVRIVALVGIIMMAMVLWAAVERQCRQGEAQKKGRTLKPITAQQVWCRFKHLGGQIVQLVDKAGQVLQQYFVLNAFSAAQEQVLGWLSITPEGIGALLMGTG